MLGVWIGPKQSNSVVYDILRHPSFSEPTVRFELPPVACQCVNVTHTEHRRFPAPSSKLPPDSARQVWLHHWRGTLCLRGAAVHQRGRRPPKSLGTNHTHTPSTAFRHLPPNSARFSYTTEEALFISAQLSSDAANALRKIWVLIRLWKQPSDKART